MTTRIELLVTSKYWDPVGWESWNVYKPYRYVSYCRCSHKISKIDGWTNSKLRNNFWIIKIIFIKLKISYPSSHTSSISAQDITWGPDCFGSRATTDEITYEYHRRQSYHNQEDNTCENNGWRFRRCNNWHYVGYRCWHVDWREYKRLCSREDSFGGVPRADNMDIRIV